ncbi:cobalamin biosynthesis protein [Kovacikia minuta CCNUW1]|uniref:cobalamin biosynthesis protein n=1 Tax=Kovacikia minuta TaxID=2931930 RepID=UPI001CCD4371|nr:cobalamin biosynthesis protein [Kovacikia minuta]UBF27961.1 cobalamin biosynthesis protein [Kovacikia minuta CCNUW1]
MSMRPPAPHPLPPAPILWVGLGCQQATSRGLIEVAIREVFRRYHLTEGAIAGIATIDSKANVAGLVGFCRDRHLPLRYFSAEMLGSVSVPNPSGNVESRVGTPSVAEAAAILGCRIWSMGRGERLLIGKQIFRLREHPGAVTIAVAQTQ